MELPRLLWVGLLVFPLLVLVIIYNGHISRRNAVDYAFSSIDVQLKKRWELVPNLVETVKGYAKHESALFERVTLARAKARTGDLGKRFMYEGVMSQEIPTLLAVSEAYPELKANEQFIWLQRNLTEIESQISASRRAYNAAITSYNDGVEMFPSSLVANLFGFKKREWFQIDSVERGVTNVSL